MSKGLLAGQISGLGLIGAGCLLAIAPRVEGAMMATATFSTVSPGRNVEVQLTNNFFATPMVSHEWTAAGLFDWTGISSNQPGLQDHFYTFCIDFNQNINYGGTYTYEVDTLAEGARPNAAGQGNSTGGIGLSLGLGTERSKDTLLRQLWAHSYDAATTDSDSAAAFQLSVWKLLYETDPNGYNSITAGDFEVVGGSANEAFVALANANLAFLTNPLNADAPQATNLVALTSDTVQDQMTIVPEPADTAVLVAPLALLGRRRRM